MSHEVEMINGQAQMAYAGDVPWHGLGTKVSSDLTPNQIMVKAGLDWSVDKVPTYAKVGDVEVETGQEALIRSSDNKVLTQVGKNWHPVQNEEAFEFFSEYCLEGSMEMHTAGSLKGGKMVWGLAKVKGEFEAVKGDPVEQFFLFSNPHEYGKSIDIRFTPIRVVCNNTLSMALASVKNTGVKLSHRKVFDPEMVKEHMGIADEKFAQYKEVAQYLASKNFSADALIQYYNEVFPRTYKGKEEIDVKTVDDLTSNGQKAFEFLETQPGAEFGAGTWWQALNSVTYLTDHEMGREVDSRLASAWFGANQTRKIRAVEKAVEFAEAA